MTDMMSMGEFFLEEAAACVDRISALFEAPESLSSPDAADELSVLVRALRDGAQMEELDTMFVLADVLDGAVQDIVAGSLAMSPEVTSAVAETLTALRTCIGGEPDAGAVQAITDRWRELRMGAGVEARVDDESGDAGLEDDVADAGASPDDEPPEVINYFRGKARAVLDRMQRIIDDVNRTGAEQPNDRNQVRTLLAELRDTAATFGFGEAQRLASEALDAIESSAALWMLEHFLNALGKAVDSGPVDTDSLGEATGAPASTDSGTAGDGDAGRSERGLPSWVDAPSAPPSAAADASSAEAEALAGDGEAPEVETEVADMAEPEAGEGVFVAVPVAAEPASDDDVVPIEAFWYRGEAALRRALELEPVVREATAADENARAAADEVFDLIRLALPETTRGRVG